MASLHQLTLGEDTEFKRILAAAGFDAEAVRKINRNPEVAAAMLEAAQSHPVFHLLHGLWTPLGDLAVQVKSWPGVTSSAVDAAIKEFEESGARAAFEAESPTRRLLGPVINVARENVPATLQYSRLRMKEFWGDAAYSEWEAAYASGVDDKRVKLIEGAREFVPNRISVEVVDFGANYDPKNGLILSEVQAAQAGDLAGFEVIYAGCQHSGWVKKMNGGDTPYAIAAAILLNVPGYDADSPCVGRYDDGASLDGLYVVLRYHELAMPVLRKYKR